MAGVLLLVVVVVTAVVTTVVVVIGVVAVMTAFPSTGARRSRLTAVSPRRKVLAGLLFCCKRLKRKS